MATLPTPLEEAGRLPSGRRLLLKRDDLTGLGLGGNKARKLELLVPDALDTGCDLLVTVGAAQSNHARVTAAAGARAGLETHLVLGGAAAADQGNQLLASLFGAQLHSVGSDDWVEIIVAMDELVQRWRAEGRRPYDLPLGGSTPLGAASFALAWLELLEQLESGPVVVDPRAPVVVASSTGGTHAGMLAGRALLGGPQVLAMSVAKQAGDLAAETLELARRALALIDAPGSVEPGEVHVDDRFLGNDYAAPTDEADAALVGLARSGGWLLDRVYTAKAFAGLLALDAADAIPSDDVIFWHTGGQPAVFAAGGAPAPAGERVVAADAGRRQ
jgi:1-aminocyclopropane-1-carboxylate deaminase/D-cysteine desulfhydrase-like pyridoxal-dependent ACC family enzyme